MSAYVIIALLVTCIALAVAVVVAVVTFRRSRQPAPPARREQPASGPVGGDGHDRPPRDELAAARDAGRVERADQLRNLLLSRMSHDLRTPLNSVITLSQLLGEGNVGALTLEQRKYVEIIHRSGQTLLALLNDILDLANLEAGRLELEFAPVDLRTLVTGAADTFT